MTPGSSLGDAPPGTVVRVVSVGEFDLKVEPLDV